MKTLICDDDPSALELLSKYVETYTKDHLINIWVTENGRDTPQTATPDG